MEDEVFFTRKLTNSDNFSSFTYEQGMRKHVLQTKQIKMVPL